RRIFVRVICQKVTPPLQTNFTGERLTDLLADARDLEIERIHGQQRTPQSRCHEQRSGIALEIGTAHQSGAMNCSLLAGAAHGTAIRPAATRRRSPIMML